jgi:Zn-finger nucleic acid-binding protein
MDCRPDLKEKKIKEQAERQKARNSVSRTQSSLRKLIREDDGVREGSKKVQSKSELLRQADMLFSEFIKRRDTKNGFIMCPCCRGRFEIDKMSNGQKVVQTLHFVDRDVYFLRFDEDNAHAGCSYCNLAQHLNPKGKEYQNYREYLVANIGEIAVAEMELVKRNINKISEQDLKNVIEHYSTLTNLNTEI